MTPIEKARADVKALNVWVRTCVEQGWSDFSRESILMDFIAQRGLLGDLAEFGKDRADEENT